MFFDAAEIEWQYEPEGYRLDGGRPYLPDFWLPKREMFVEVKPTKEAGAESISLMKQLVDLTGKVGLVISGKPNVITCIGSRW